MSDAPDPSRASDLAEYISLLGELRAWAGSPPYRVLAKRVGPLMRPPQAVSASTVVDVFKPTRLRLNLDLVLAIVRALGLKEDEVDRWRQAYVRVHTHAKNGGPVGAFRQLPADLVTFTGREKELARLVDQAISPDGAAGATTVVISAIEGMAGIGKTQLALHAAHALVKAGRYADLQLYVNLRGFDPDQSPADPAAVLDAFLRQLGVAPAQIPEGLEERAAMFRDRMHDRSGLVLLDNAADEEQVRALIPGGSGCLVLITSRRSLAALDGAFVHQLDVFEQDEALALLARIVGTERIDAEPEAAVRIVQACGRLPLAVSIAAGWARSRPRWSLADVAERLGGSLDAISVGGRALTPVFDLSYRSLPESARRVFALLSLHPGPEFGAAAVTALAEMSEPEAVHALELLLHEHLVQEKAPGRFELHDLLRAYAGEQAAAELSENDRIQSMGRVLEWYAFTAINAAKLARPVRPSMPIRIAGTPGLVLDFQDRAHALTWYELERANLFRAVETAQRLRLGYLAWYLPMAIAPFSEATWSWRELEANSLVAWSFVEHAGDSFDKGRILHQIGSARNQLGEPASAVEPLEAALRESRRAGDFHGSALCLNSLALTATQLGEPETGLRHLHEALALYDQIGEDGGFVLAILNSIATCLHDMDRAEEAVGYILKVVDKATDVGDQTLVAIGLRNLGFTYFVLNRLDEAQAALESALTVSCDIKEHYMYVDSLNGIARILQAKGNLTEARNRHEQSLAYLAELPPAEADRYRELVEKSPLRYEG